MGDMNEPHSETMEITVVETFQQLIVAFVLAMIFRGFVAEGFVIPTGSMAPTLKGEHLRAYSPQTGAEFAAGLDMKARGSQTPLSRLTDPMLGPQFPGTAEVQGDLVPRMGDRIFVLKSLYPFFEPKRFDVVVFKNPTGPLGDSQNYIKRLVGLPEETIFLVDGDVFVKKRGEGRFHVQRKPEYVQRAVWQRVGDSDLYPGDPVKLKEVQRAYGGVPWGGAGWNTEGTGSYSCATGEASRLRWDGRRRPITDWNAYNVFRGGRGGEPVSDIRVMAGVVRTEPGMTMVFELRARGQVYQWVVTDTEAKVRMRAVDDDEEGWREATGAISLPGPGRVFEVEFWHQDQAMMLFLGGERVVELDYDWTPEERLRFVTGEVGSDVPMGDLVGRAVFPPQIVWKFEGSPVTLHRVRVDRDLHYRHDALRSRQKNGPRITGPHAFGTHPDILAELGPDQFMMLGDNSPASQDSRLWGRPHPLVKEQIDDAPFLVNRKLLLGKAWVVYFPSPLPLGGRKIIPDFGRLRFIR